MYKKWFLSLCGNAVPPFHSYHISIQTPSSHSLLLYSHSHTGGAPFLSHLLTFSVEAESVKATTVEAIYTVAKQIQIHRLHLLHHINTV